MSELVIIGLGGIGPHVASSVSYGLRGAGERTVITLVDGGSYKPDHRDHELFDELGNKAKVQKKKLSREFPEIFYRSIPFYVAEKDGKTAQSVARIVTEGGWILLGVDNHKTRKIISDFGETLKNVTIISGSNDGADTCLLQVFIRRNGKNITSPLTFGHPHISNPKDHSPAEETCEQRASSGKQLPATLVACACLMQNAFHTSLRLEKEGKLKEYPYSEIYWNIALARYRAVERNRG